MYKLHYKVMKHKGYMVVQEQQWLTHRNSLVQAFGVNYTKVLSRSKIFKGPPVKKLQEP